MVFILAPRLGAAIFGLPAPDGAAAAWPAVVGLRDLAFGLYILLLARFATRRAVGLVLAATVLIPVGDLVLLMTVGGASAMHLLLHLASALVVAGVAWWTLREA